MTTCSICLGSMPAKRNNGNPSRVCSNSCLILLMRQLNMAETRREVDEAVVDRLCAGQRIDSSLSERLEATRILSGRGEPLRLIATRLRVAERTVRRYRRELRAAWVPICQGR